MKTTDIWIFWKDETIREWFQHAGLVDTSPAIPTLARITSAGTEFKRRFTVAAVDVNTGVFETFDQNNLAFDELPIAAFASGSMPAAFPPVHFRDFVLMDGGTVYDVNVDSVVT